MADLLMSTGPRRMDWRQDGPPTRAEMGWMLAWRKATIEGRSSLMTAGALGGLVPNDQATAAQKPTKAQPRTIAEAFHLGPVARPPGMADDDPRVLSGAYR